MEILLVALGLVLFVGLVVVHEYGHFIFARRNGVEVEEFGIGFPPRIWGKKIKSKKGDYLFSLNWLPLGGFVRLKGESDAATAKGSFGAASTLAKTKIMAAGVGMNLLTALVLFTLVALIGMPKILDNQFTVASDTTVVREPKNKGLVKIGELTPDSPAKKAGLKLDDQLVSVAGTPITSPQKLVETTKANAGKQVEVVTKAEGKGPVTRTVTLRDTSPYLGIGPYSGQDGLEFRRSTWSAPIVAFGVTWDFTKATFAGLGKALQGVGSIIAGTVTGNSEARRAGQTEASSQVSGPVGIFAVLQSGASQGIAFILFIVAIISLSLAIMNILPIPALDGGKLFITYISRLFGRRVSENFENYAYGISFLLLIGLMILITFVDVKRFYL
jgi:regulator of sigma E protease